MPTRTLWRRLWSPGGFVLVACLFFLPFVTVSCGPSTGEIGTATFSGTALAVGQRPSLTPSDEFNAQWAHDQPELPNPPVDEATGLYTQPIGLQPFILIALFCVGFGIAAAAIRWPWSRALAGGGLALAAITFLVGGEVISLRSAETFINSVVEQLFGNPAVGVGHIAYGFWLALAALIGVAAVNWIDLVRHSRTVPDPPTSSPAGSPELSIEDGAGRAPTSARPYGES